MNYLGACVACRVCGRSFGDVRAKQELLTTEPKRSLEVIMI